MGKDPTTLARDVEKALSKYIRDPVVTVIVTNFNGPYPEQIRVVGEAAKPQALSYRQGMTLLDVMIAVGGLTGDTKTEKPAAEKPKTKAKAEPKKKAAVATKAAVEVEPEKVQEATPDAKPAKRAPRKKETK